MSVVELATRTGATRQGVNAVLHRLEECRLAERSDDPTRWRGVDRDLDDVAEALGVALRPEFRAQTNTIARAARADALGRRGTERPARFAIVHELSSRRTGVDTTIPSSAYSAADTGVAA